ncbi:MAG TPA: phage tail sheath subtilisin-like domain-containing protein [Thermoanaerobaculia bacterium]
MPEYLAPGVYVEEVSFRAKSIEGVSTTTTGFVGPTRFGPVELVPDVITSLVEYERIYGDRQQLEFGGSKVDNYMWHAVRMFFENGGKRLYVARVFAGGAAQTIENANDQPVFPKGHAIVKTNGGKIWTYARFPGAGGNMRVRITLTAGANVFDPNTDSVRGIVQNDVLLVDGDKEASDADLWFANRNGDTWQLLKPGNPATTKELSEVTKSIQVVTATVTVTPSDPNVPSSVYPDLALDSNHRRNGADDTLAAQFASNQPSMGRARSIPIVMDLKDLKDGRTLADEIFSLKTNLEKKLLDPLSSDADRSLDLILEGGSDGTLPEVGEYDGKGGSPDDKFKSGLKALEDIDEISIVAAPAASANFQTRKAESMAILNSVVSHAQRMRYRIAVLDSGNGQSIADVRDMRGKLDSSYAAFYYPWITVFDPVTQKEINLPPSGAVAGIYARNDINRGVFKAPANEVVDGAIGLETLLNKSQQDILNPIGINCFRFFEGRGFRLWGARTISSDPEWKYVNLRRYFAYLEHSIDRGTQWAVFEPNGERLWANVRITITDFLFNEWQNGALLGDRAEKAFFVKCDRSTMTQNDLDNGRLVCLVGVAALRPAEYVIIRVGQWTADRKV